MQLGRNFRLYDDISVRQWDSGECRWGYLSPQSASVCTIRLLRRGEEEPVAKVWAQGFPELFRGTYGFVLDPNAYEMFFDDEWRMFVFEYTDTSVVGAWLLRLDQPNLSVDFTLVVVHPDFRGKGLLKATAAILDDYVNECGVELATIAAARFHTATRRVFRGLGFTSVGILPGAIRANVGGQYYRRDSVEIMYKLYRNAAQLVPPIETE